MEGLRKTTLHLVLYGLSTGLLTLLLICLGLSLPVHLVLYGLSTGAQADGPVVRVVLFWSETCPHCHVVLNETLPPLQEQYGDQLEVYTVNVSEPAHYELFLEAIETFQLPPERRAVPMLIIGDTVLIGSREIPDRLPSLIKQHLAAGGVDYPAIPGLAARLTPTPTSTPLPPTPPPTTPDPRVHFWLFWDSHCGPCLTLVEDILPPILAKYEAGQVVVHQNDLEKGGYELMRALEKQHGLEYGDMPEIFIGDQVLLGNEEIQARLGLLIDQYLAQGGVVLPEVDLSPTPTPTPTTAAESPPIHLAYFYQPGCRECDQVQLDLNYLQHRYPQLVVHDFDVKAEAALAEWLGQRAGVPEEKRLTAPAVFVGDEGLVGQDLHARNLEALIARHTATGAEAVWEASQSGAAEGIIERFRSFGLLTVLAAGLVDGLNPCAFATIVFFISYLTFMDRRGWEVLAVGAAFALGVFLTYLGVGVGLLKFLAALPFLSALSRWVYGLTAVLCLFLAAGSLHDWWQVRKGNPEDMRLKLPTRLRRWINRVIREGAGLRAFVPVAFATGAVISVIELACTGQVYLPTIIFVLGAPGLQARAGVYMLLYNLMFVLPLVVVFLLAYFGTTSQQLGQFINRRAATIKLATAGLFILLAGWLVTALV